MQTKIIVVLVALVIVGGAGAYAFSTRGSTDSMMKDDSMMPHEDNSMMYGEGSIEGDMTASTSVDAMMH